MQRRVAVLAGCAATALISATPVLAQVVGAPPLAPGAGSLIIDQQRQDRQLPVAPAPAPAPKPAPTVETGGQTAPTVALKEIRLAGSERLKGKIGALTARFAGQPLNTQTIKQAADAVSAAYAETGLALYTVAVPRQDLSNGVLTLYVVEGHIGQVVIQGDPRVAKNKLVLAYVAKLKAERPLTKAKLERYLSLIRDVPGLTVDAQLYNTTIPGTVQLTLTVHQKRFVPDFTLNNSGTPRLGSVQGQATLTLNSLARAGDQGKLLVSAPSDLNRFLYIGGSYATPIGSNGLTLIGNASYLRTRPDNPPIDGDAASAGIQLSYPLLRGYTKNLTISGGVDGLNSDNAIYGLSITSDHTRAIRAGLTYGVATPRRNFSASITGSQGVDILGARADARLTDGDFTKANIQAGVDQAVGKAFVLRLRAMSQVSSGRLPAAEQMPLGGPIYGRAFFSAEVVGDYGYAGSAELGWRSATLWPAPLKGSELYGFVDGGEAWVRERLPYAAGARYSLASAGAGVRFLVHEKSSFDFEAAKVVDPPYAGQNKPWRVIISWRLAR